MVPPSSSRINADSTAAAAPEEDIQFLPTGHRVRLRIGKGFVCNDIRPDAQGATLAANVGASTTAAARAGRVILPPDDVVLYRSLVDDIWHYYEALGNSTLETTLAACANWGAQRAGFVDASWCTDDSVTVLAESGHRPARRQAKSAKYEPLSDEDDEPAEDEALHRRDIAGGGGNSDDGDSDIEVRFEPRSPKRSRKPRASTKIRTSSKSRTSPKARTSNRSGNFRWRAGQLVCGPYCDLLNFVP